jgi:hypothetical protein
MLNLGLSSVSTQLTNDRSRLTNLETSVNNPNVFVAASATARDAKYGNPATLTGTQRKALQDLGVLVYRTDLGITERFWAVYNATTNPIGASVFGWYPVNGGAGVTAARTNTGQSIPNAAYTLATFNSYSNYGTTMNSTTAPSTFTVLQEGYYLISFHCHVSSWSSTAGTTRAGGATKNSVGWGTNILVNPAANSTTSGAVSQSAIVKLAANDVIRFYQYQDSGGNATSNGLAVSITYLRPSQI